MKTIIQSALLLLAFLLSATADAHDFDVDGIYYVINGNEAAVSYRGSSYNEYSDEYSGIVSIPATVTYDGSTYTVTSIGDYAFFNCSGLTNVSIPNTVTSIGSRGFANCSGLMGMDIPNSVVSIGSYAFFGCSSMTSLSISNSLTSLSNYVFAYCSSLTNVSIPNTITTISYYAFNGCTALESVNIPKSVTSIYSYAFASCPGLTSITVADDNQYYDSRNNCNAIIETASNTLLAGCVNTIIPNSVTCIGVGSFYECLGLTSLTIPNSVTIIDGWSFSGCSGLTSLTIPSSVIAINNYAFQRCGSLTDIYCLAATPPVIGGSNTFTSYTATLHVLEESVAAYSAADYWCNFNIAGDVTPPALKGDLNGDGRVNITDVTVLINYLLNHHW